MSTIALLRSIEALYPAMRLPRFLDNARYHEPSLSATGWPSSERA